MSRSIRACIRRVTSLPPALAALVFMALAPHPAEAAAKWTTSGPYGGVVNVVVVDPTNPDRLYETSPGGGVFRSVDRGAHWTRAASGLKDPICFTLAIDPKNSDVVYAGCSQGVFRSADRGARWTMAAGLVNVRKIAIDPKTTSRLFAVVSQGPLYKSEDSGATWVSQFNVLQSQNLYALAIDPTNPKKIYVGAQGGVYRTSNGGKSWSLSAEGLGTGFIVAQYLLLSPSDPETLYVSYGSGLARSTNAGRSWTPLPNAPSQVIPLAVDPSKPKVFYSTVYPGRIIVTKDGGGSFVETTLIKPGYAGNIRTLAVDPASSDRLYAGADHGVFASADKGKTWREANDGLSNVLVTALAVDPASAKTVYAGTQYGGLFKSTAGGAWRRIDPDYIDKITAVLVDPSAPSTLYYASSFGNGVRKSTDGGDSWTGVLPSVVTALALDPAKPNVLYAAGGSAIVQKSTDAGASWSPTNSGLPTTLRPNSVSVFDGEALVTDDTQGAFSSSNGGKNWKSDSPTVPSASSEVERRADPSFYNIALGFALGRAGGAAIQGLGSATPSSFAIFGFLRFQTKGASLAAASSDWTPWYPPKGVDASECFPIGALAGDPSSLETVYAGGGCGVMKVTKGGAKVVTLGAGLPKDMAVGALAVDPTGDVVYAGMYGGGVYSLSVK